MNELINGKVYYKIFDKDYKQSSHIYTNKNLSNPVLIKEIEQNKQAIVSYLLAKDILILQQIHSNQIIDADIRVDSYFTVDGIVTTKKDLVLTVQTADCVPVLCSSDDGKVIGSAHCGWRGSKAGIINNLVKLMKNAGAKHIKAIIGPSIQQYSYEVNQEYYYGFIKEKANNSRLFINSQTAGYYMFDLPSYVELKLQEAGIQDITKMLDDTYSQPAKYPSYRRACHSGAQENQRILSTIVIRG